MVGADGLSDTDLSSHIRDDDEIDQEHLRLSCKDDSGMLETSILLCVLTYHVNLADLLVHREQLRRRYRYHGKLRTMLLSICIS